MLSTLQTLNMSKERFYDIKISMNAYEYHKLWVWFLNTHCWSQEKFEFATNFSQQNWFSLFLNAIRVILVVLLLFIDIPALITTEGLMCIKAILVPISAF